MLCYVCSFIYCILLWTYAFYLDYVCAKPLKDGETLHSNNIKNCSEQFVFLHQHMCTVEVCNSFSCVVFLASMKFISRAAPNPVKTSIRHSSLSHCFCFFGVYGHLLIHGSLKVPPQHFRQPGQSRLDWAKATP